MRLKRTLSHAAHALLATAALTSSLAAMAAWPTKSIQIVVGFSPGGSADVLARALADSMSKSLNQSVVVVNREGAAGTIAMTAAARGDDAHTFSFGPAGPLVLQPHIKPVQYKLSDVVGVCQTFVNNYALVAAPNSKYKTLRDVLNDPQAKGDGLPFGTGGLGSVPHLGALQLGLQTGTKFQAVAYRGDPPVALALKGGEIELGTVSVGLAQSQGLLILGVFAPERVSTAPDAPTFKEQGVPVVAQLFGGLYAPRSLPEEAFRAIETACQEAARSDRYAQATKSSQQDLVYRGSGAFNRAIEAESKAFGEVIRKTNLKLD